MLTAYSQEIISRGSLTKESGELDTLKIVNIIFAEHQKFSIENPLLKDKISSLEKLNQLHLQTDSLRKEQVSICKNTIESKDKQIKQLKSSRRKIIGGSVVGGIVLFIIGLFI